MPGAFAAAPAIHAMPVMQMHPAETIVEIVPVQILGDQDGTWDRTAWRSAFYGNPLTGFTPAP